MKAGVTALLLALVALPFLPETVRITLPGSWKLPHIEFVHKGAGPGQDELAGADSAAARGQDQSEASVFAPGLPLDAIRAERSAGSGEGRLAHTRPTARLHRATRQPVEQAQNEFEQSEDVTYVPEHGVSLIPKRVKTEVRLASAPDHGALDVHDPTTPAAEDKDVDRSTAAHADRGDGRDWPLLCGQVVDESGAPVGGASVELESPSLTVTTDRNGHFCLASPEGVRTLWIDGGGRGRATRVVSLQRGFSDLRIALSQRR
ncbi:MAG TPA: carboxypeptidase-like regulatory domain-containing protein [Candidatus Eisenbacteria bacterium]|jgi:hypothetical protein